MQFLEGEPDVEYPCRWEYRLIGAQRGPMVQAASEIASIWEYTVRDSNRSKTGKYVSVILEVQVPDEGARRLIFKMLSDHDDIIMVL
ncbi:MAG: DUF493 domain-containing protein [Phycisphaerae bacterium]